MNKKLKPAIIAGLAGGLLLGIPGVNVLCFGYGLLASMLAVFLYVRSTTIPATSRDGAILGLLTGGVASIFNIVIGVPFSTLAFYIFRGYVASQADYSGMWRRINVQGELSKTTDFQVFLQVLLLAILGSFLFLIFSIIGGILGVALFGKRKTT